MKYFKLHMNTTKFTIRNWCGENRWRRQELNDIAKELNMILDDTNSNEKLYNRISEELSEELKENEFKTNPTTNTKMDNKILEEKIFEPLYCKDIKGKIKTWKLKVEKYQDFSVIVTLYGYNRLIETRRQINSGKNIGKSNETSHFTQAISEAQSKWTKKRDIELYTTKIVGEQVKDELVEKTENVNLKETNPLPMLAQDYKKQKKKVQFPCNIQPKLDGMRMIYNTTTGQISTRQGKEYNIIKESGKLYDELKSLPKGLILDGELYTNKVNFEDLGVLRKTKKLTKEDLTNLQKIEYHIYDIIDTKITFEERNKLIQNLFKEKYNKLIYVPTFTVNSEAEIQENHIKFLEEKYEGTMVRNTGSLYKIKQRSSDLLKYKDFQDSEFKIIDYTVEKDTSGSDENLVVWVVEVSKDKFCKVRPQGTKEERQELYKKCVENFDEFKGRPLWTKFFEMTADGNLRFPSTMRNTFTEYIRDEII
jgi:DNA ligase 1